MAKLHEVLAVLSELAGAAKNILAETLVTFTKKTEHFSGFHRRYEPFDEAEKLAAAAETTSRELVTTVDDKLRYMFGHLVTYANAEAQRDATNQKASAPIVIDGKLLMTDVPGTWLLGMEKRMVEWRAVLLAIPTLPPGEAWIPDSTRGAHVYTHPRSKESLRTRKTVQHKILVQPTKEHPAQLEKWNEDVPCGKWIVEEWAGAMTPAEKSELLARFDKLSRAIVQARMQANNVDVVAIQPMQKLVDYVLDGKFPAA